MNVTALAVIAYAAIVVAAVLCGIHATLSAVAHWLERRQP